MARLQPWGKVKREPCIPAPALPKKTMRNKILRNTIMIMINNIMRQAGWSIVLGLCSGLFCVAALLGFIQLQWCFTHSRGQLPAAAAALPLWWRASVPVLGALLATALLRLRGHLDRKSARPPEPVTNYVEAVRRKGGRIPLGPNLWRIANATFSIGSGASLGREGAMIQFATSMTSALGQRVRVQRGAGQNGGINTFSLPQQVACGVAAAVAAAYKAPFTGVFFASEIVLGADAPAQYPTLLIASLTGWLVSRAILGADRLFPVVAALPHPALVWLFLPLLALALGLMGPAYQSVIRGSQSMRRLPLPLLWGGLATGLLSLASPGIWGNGAGGLLVLTGGAASPALRPVLSLLLLRILSTSACVGVGTVGGVLTPTLFTGASLGFLAAHALHAPVPLVFTLVGLASLLAAATHAPLMAACMAVELTGAWALFPVLLGCTLIASFAARRVSSRSLYGIASTDPAKNQGDAQK